MNLSQFKHSLSQPEPPRALSSVLKALWWSARGEWDRAHAIVMDDASREAAWVHAHLHRVEGDQANAGYWYRQAGKPKASGPLDAEWDTIARTLLAESARPSARRP